MRTGSRSQTAGTAPGSHQTCPEHIQHKHITTCHSSPYPQGLQLRRELPLQKRLEDIPKPALQGQSRMARQKSHCSVQHYRSKMSDFYLAPTGGIVHSLMCLWHSSLSPKGKLHLLTEKWECLGWKSTFTNCRPHLMSVLLCSELVVHTYYNTLHIYRYS